MIVSREKRIAFIHVPKTGGVSISEALGAALSDAEEVGPIHSTATEARKEFRDFDRYKSFAFVRNPWERMVSLYAYLKVPVAFEDFLLRPVRPFTPFRRSQAAYVNDLAGRRVVSFVGRFEYFIGDMSRICSILGIALTIRHMNMSTHPHFQEMYGEETRDFVARTYADDIAEFGYSFEGRS